MTKPLLSLPNKHRGTNSMIDTAVAANRWFSENVVKGGRSSFADKFLISPIMAATMLADDNNADNRDLVRKNKRDLHNEIAAGRFRLNGETIIVRDNGKLLDGQHRLLACIDTGVPIESFIVFGIKDKPPTDLGANKTTQTFLKSDGKKYPQILSSAANYLMQWQKLNIVNHSTPFSKNEIYECASATTGLGRSIEVTTRCVKTVGNHALLAFCHYVFTKASNRSDADYFFDKLADGDGLRKGDPILYCRNKLIQSKDRVGSKSELIFKCWNAHRTGASMSSLRFTGGELPKVQS